MAKTFTQEDLNVRLFVTAGFSISAGLYDGPLTRKIIAALIQNQIDAGGGIETFIDKISIEGLSLDDGTALVEGCE